MEGLTYYIQNWDTNMVSMGAVLCLILVVSGYFYGKILQNFIEPLEKIDATFLGIFLIFAVFEIFIFACVSMQLSTNLAYFLTAFLILASPLLCLLTWSNVLPSWNNLFGLLTGLGVSYVLFMTAKDLNTNNIFFDSIHYLSAVLESSVQDKFAHLNYYDGSFIYGLDQFHDYEGFVYFWGMLLRWVNNLTKFRESLTPVYIWGASFVYWMALGNLIWNSVTVVFKKWWKIIGIAAAIVILSPYYTNYWNTTLAFFGNSLRTVIIGFGVLLAFLYLQEEHDGSVFIANMIVTYAALFTSSSGFFLEAFITAALFFCMTWLNDDKLSSYVCFIISCLPLTHFAAIIIQPFSIEYWKVLLMGVVPILVLLVIALLIRNHLDTFNKIMRWLLPVAFVALVVLSFLNRNGEFPYSYFFAQRSNMDMCNNFTGNYEARDPLRNYLLYGMLALVLIRPSKEMGFKLFLLILAVLFINPLVQPAISTYATSYVYSRVFDLVVNPFTITFLIGNIINILTFENYWYIALAGILPIAGIAYLSYDLGRENLEVPYTNNLIFKEDGFDWETKVAPDSWELYDWINRNIPRNNEERPIFLSQDIGLKGYVADIGLAFSSSDYRDALADEAKFEEHRKMLGILYPEKRYREDEINGEAGDYADLSDTLIKYEAEYLIIRNTIALWDERGWYNKSYQTVINSGQAEVLYENETWALLKVNTDWEPAPAETTEETTEETN